MELRDKNGLTEREFLAAYQPKNYERPSLTADIAVFSVSETETRLLLIRRGGHPFLGKWALPGGFVNKNETADEAAVRELSEETGLTQERLTPVGLFSKPGRDPRTWVVSQAFVTVVPEDRLAAARAGDDAASVCWFQVRSERSGMQTRLHFSSPETSFSVLAEWDDAGKFRVPEGDSLAFDHSEIIACAMKTAGLL